MSMFRRLRTAPLVVSLALLGAWLGHTLEYVRVSGTAGLRAELTGSIHAYMLPAGIILGLAVVAMAALGGYVYRSLGRRLRASRSRLLTVLATHGAVDSSPRPRPRPSRTAPRLAQLWFLVLATQLGVYVVQERFEALRVGVDRPWLSAVSGAHWASPLIHAATALLVCGAAVVALRLIGRRRGVVERSERLLAAVVARLRGRPDAWQLPRSTAVRLRLRGTHLWSRPPPVASAL